MTKSELILSLTEKLADVDNTTAQDAVNVLLTKISSNLEEGGRIEIRGFGSFRLNDWAPRHARNPVTGESWRTPPTRSVYFKPGKELRERVNFNDDKAE